MEIVKEIIRMEAPKYKRVLLKISGEALAGDERRGLNFDVINKVADAIKECTQLGVQVGVVVGGGNFWLERKEVDVRVQTAIEMKSIAEPYIRARAVRHLEKGRVVIFGCGTGNPFFSTDTGAVLRASEIDADMILLAKNVDGVYNADPAIDPNAVRFDEIDYDTVLAKHLEVMDFTATSLAMECQIPVMLFALKDPQNIVRAVMGEEVGTIVH